MKFLLASMIIVPVVLSCKSKSDIVASSNNIENSIEVIQNIVVDPNYIEKESDPFEIVSASANNNDLELVVSYGGGCKTHEFNAYTIKIFMKSLPPKLGITIEHNANGDMCKALITDTLHFNLNDVKYPGKDNDYEVILKLNKYDQSISYKY